VDAVWVCTEPFNRREIVTTAAQAGKHIFTEKPVANTLADADAMIAAAHQAKVKYMLGYCLRFWQPYRLFRDTFMSGELGELTSCWMRRFMPWNPRKMVWPSGPERRRDAGFRQSRCGLAPLDRRRCEDRVRQDVPRP